MAYIRKA